jgi:hypothetical protein
MSATQLKYELFEEELLAPLRGHVLTPDEEFVASVLLDASSSQPIGINKIRRLNQDLRSTSISDRRVKQIVRALKRNHEFPILSRRVPRLNKPAGYWWCQSEEEMVDYYVRARRQPLDELTTLSRMVKANYPKLAGQLGLEEFSRQ